MPSPFLFFPHQGPLYFRATAEHAALCETTSFKKCSKWAADKIVIFFPPLFASHRSSCAHHHVLSVSKSALTDLLHLYAVLSSILHLHVRPFDAECIATNKRFTWKTDSFTLQNWLSQWTSGWMHTAYVYLEWTYQLSRSSICLLNSHPESQLEHSIIFFLLLLFNLSLKPCPK